MYGYSDFNNELNHIRLSHKRKLDVFRTCAEKDGINNIDRREEFIVRVIWDIENQWKALRSKNKDNSKYLNNLCILYKFFIDAITVLGSDLKCLDYVDFCCSDEQHSILKFTSGDINCIKNNDSEIHLQTPIPYLQSKAVDVENYEKENIILLDSYNKLLEILDYDSDDGRYLGHTNLINNLAYAIDCYVFNEIIKYCNNKEVDGTWSKRIPENVSMRDHYETINYNISECEGKIFSKTKKYTPNYILCGASLIPIISLLNDFEPNKNNKVGSGAINIGKLQNKDVCVLSSLSEPKLILGCNYNINNCSYSDVLFQFSHIFRLPDVEDMIEPVYMDAVVKIMTDNLQVIEVSED